MGNYHTKKVVKNRNIDLREAFGANLSGMRHHLWHDLPMSIDGRGFCTETGLLFWVVLKSGPNLRPDRSRCEKVFQEKVSGDRWDRPELLLGRQPSTVALSNPPA